MFSAAVWSLNQDPLRPKVIAITRLAHAVGDLRIPGSRWGIDNPDSIYRVIPISGGERYVIRGRVAERRMTENYFTLWDEKMNTVDVLSGGDLVLDADRRFDDHRRQPTRRTAAPTTSARRPRPTSSTSATSCSTGRRTMPNELSIERLGDPPSHAATHRGRAGRAHRELHAPIRGVHANAHAGHAADARRTSSASPTRPTRAARSASRSTSAGTSASDEDEAMVIDVSDGGAALLRGADQQHLGHDARHRRPHRAASTRRSRPQRRRHLHLRALAQGSRGAQLDRSLRLGEGILTLRMAEFPGGRPNGDLSATSRVVPLSELRDSLPAETKVDDARGERAGNSGAARSEGDTGAVLPEP